MISGQNYIGCTARSIFEECVICKSYHHPKMLCPRFEIPKWRHNDELPRENILYNAWFAKNDIANHNTAVLVEGPADVWRLDEAGINCSLAILGSDLSRGQSRLLNTLGVLNLYLLFDNDEAGQQCTEHVFKYYRHVFNIVSIPFSKHDIGEMTPDEVKKEICPILKV
jgi:DNA primase